VPSRYAKTALPILVAVEEEEEEDSADEVALAADLAAAGVVLEVEVALGEVEEDSVVAMEVEEVDTVVVEAATVAVKEEEATVVGTKRLPTPLQTRSPMVLLLAPSPAPSFTSAM
jgi:hypothetical protein